MIRLSEAEFEAHVERIAKVQTYVSIRKIKAMAEKVIVNQCIMMITQITAMNALYNICDRRKRISSKKATDWVMEFHDNLYHKATIKDLIGR